ncbi:MAG: DNA polymerase III subunit chi [Alphaproteobacteria bacterium]|nr:DNA polymerase III subunit chi [Alphaproteobacteria bacterium]
MTAINFYHLERSTLEQALTQLLEKVLANQARAVVLAGSEERVEALNAALWVSPPHAFLPHGSRQDGHAADQPVWLTTEDENPNAASVLVLTDDMASARMGEYERCLELFNGQDPDAVNAARERWRRYREEGHELIYWQQTSSGGWEKKET